MRDGARRRRRAGRITRLLALAALLWTAPALAEIEWSIRHAAGGIHRFGEPIPTAVTLDNSEGGDTTVVVRARMQGGPLRREVELPAGAIKRFTFYLMSGDYTDRYEIELAERDAGDAFGKFELVSEGMSGEVVAVGILGADPMGWEALEADDDDSIDLRRGHIRPADLPPHAEGLKAYDLLVWPDPEPGQLRPEQVRAVTQWVAEGGQLAILVAERWLEASAGGLQPWTTIEVAAPVPARGLAAVAADEAAGPLEFDPPLSVPLLFGGQSWIDEPFGSVARHERRGLGRVTVIAFDPSRPELSGWSGWPGFWRGWLHRWRAPAELAELRQEVALTGAGEPLFERLRAVSTVRLPRPQWILILFLLYLMVIGPVEYFLLRRKRRLHWTWWTFPVLIVVASSAGYLAAETAHEGSSVKQGVILRDLWSDYDLVSEETRMSAYVTRQGLYRMSALDAASLALPCYDVADPAFAWRRSRMANFGDPRLDQGPAAIEGRVAKWSHLRGRFVRTHSAAGATAGAVWRAESAGGGDDAFPEAEGQESVVGRVTLDLGVENDGVWLLAVTGDDGWPVLYALGSLADGQPHEFEANGVRLTQARGVKRGEPQDRPALASLIGVATASPLLARRYGYNGDPRQFAGVRGGLIPGRRIDWSAWLEKGGGVLLVETAATEEAVFMDAVPAGEATRVFYRIPIGAEGMQP